MLQWLDTCVINANTTMLTSSSAAQWPGYRRGRVGGDARASGTPKETRVEKSHTKLGE